MSIRDIFNRIFNNKETDERVDTRRAIEEETEEIKSKIDSLAFNAKYIVNHLGNGKEYSETGLTINNLIGDITITFNGQYVLSRSMFYPVYKSGEWEELINELYTYARRQMDILDMLEKATPEYHNYDQYDENTLVDYRKREITYDDYKKYDKYGVEYIDTYNVYYHNKRVFSVEILGYNAFMLSYEPGEWEDVVKATVEARKKTPEQIAEEREAEKQKQKSLFEERLSQLKGINNK